MNSEKISFLISLIDDCIWVYGQKQLIGKVKQETKQFEDEFARKYAVLVKGLEAAVAKTEDPMQQELLKKAFVVAAVALMRGLLQKYGKRSARSAWRPEEPTTDLNAFLLSEENDWEAATLDGFLPKLQTAVEYQAEDDLAHRLAVVGSYGLLFGGMIWSVFWGSRVTSGGPDIMYLWDGMDDTETCVDCAYRIGRTYRASRLPGMPGNRSTVCDGNCRCWLQQLSPDEAMIAEETMPDLRLWNRLRNW